MTSARSRPSLRDEHANATRTAVLAAARSRFANAGYANTSIDEIAAEARVTKGAVYHHFENKRELFRAVVDEVEREAAHVAGAAGARAKSPIQAILAGIDAYLDLALSPEVQRITVLDAPAVLGPDPWDPETVAAAHAGLRSLVADAVKTGAMKRVDPDAMAHLIRGNCLHAATLIAQSDNPAATRTVVGRTLHTMFKGLQPS